MSLSSSRILAFLRSAWVPLLLSGAAVLAQFFPEALQFDRAAIARGQVWRLVTGHWPHWSWNHLLWSGGMFALLAMLSRKQLGAKLAGWMVVWAVSISAAVWWWTDLAHYRGLSGIDSALFVVVAVDVLRDAIASKKRARAGAIVLLLAGLIGKIIFESITGTAIFVSSDASGMVPVPLAHLAGAWAGVVWSLGARAMVRRGIILPEWRTRKPRTSPTCAAAGSAGIG